MQNITFNFAKNPELKEVFARWEIGESYEVTVRFQLNEQDENEARGTIEDIEIPAEGDGESETTVIEPDAKEPVMMVMMAEKPESMMEEKGMMSKASY